LHLVYICVQHCTGRFNTLPLCSIHCRLPPPTLLPPAHFIKDCRRPLRGPGAVQPLVVFCALLSGCNPGCLRLNPPLLLPNPPTLTPSPLHQDCGGSI
jgi:hypothetical protein